MAPESEELRPPLSETEQYWWNRCAQLWGHPGFIKGELGMPQPSDKLRADLFYLAEQCHVRITIEPAGFGDETYVFATRIKQS